MSDDNSTKEKIVSCNGSSDGTDLHSGHPKIYVKVAEGEEKPCPYCGRLLQ
ncbi:zinc-finger domain-containing protein [Anaplasma bovis]|uniref:zinc-finger domain-containing protein n=1 Tax=Anaplasma bovis TaxID=186733 RepID=UPI002FF3024E